MDVGLGGIKKVGETGDLKLRARMSKETIIDVGEQRLDLTSPVVMSIINVTPDSFWSGSRNATDEQIEERIRRAMCEGATMLDVGGYSSRPGADDVSPEEELERVSRAVRVIRREYPEVVVSVDTFRASVARGVVEQFGECVINDISAGELDEKMLETVAELKVPYIAMHMRSTPQAMQQHTDYADLVGEVMSYFREKIEQLNEAGIEQIILDPGFGFAKTTRQNYQLMKQMERLGEFGYPVLSGVSRKSMIYKVLEIEPSGALAGTCALHWESLLRGAKILRVHDTREAAEIVKLYDYYKKA